METSQKLSLNSLDRKKIGKGALIAIIGVLLTYVADLIPTIDFGAYTPIIVVGNYVLANIVRKWIASNQ